MWAVCLCCRFLCVTGDWQCGRCVCVADFFVLLVIGSVGGVFVLQISLCYW